MSRNRLNGVEIESPTLGERLAATVANAATRSPAFSIARLVDAGPDEPAWIVTNGLTAVRDAASGWFPGDNGYLVTVPNAGTSVMELDVIVSPRVFGKAQALQIAIDTISGGSAVTFVNYQIWQTALNDEIWARALTGIPSGVTRIRSNIGAVTDNWGTAYKLRLTFQTTGAWQGRLRRIVAEVKEFPEIQLVTDGAYLNNFTSGFYAQLERRGFPLELALLPGQIGSNVGSVNEMPSLAFLRTLYHRNRNVVSAHSWGVGTEEEFMTTAQIHDESKKLHTFFSSEGLPRPFMKMAWLRNRAPNHAGAQTSWAAYATPTEVGSYDIWPPVNKWDVPRIGLGGRTQIQIAGYITDIGRTNGFAILYWHGVDPSGGIHMHPNEAGWLLAELDRGVAQYKLKVVNQFELFERLGTTIEITPQGEDVLVETDNTGARTRRILAN